MATAPLKAGVKTARLRSRIAVGNPSLSILQFDLEEDFHFEPGQHVTLSAETEAHLAPRPYSIASSRYDRRSLEFYVRGDKPGDLTSHLLSLQAGDPIWYSEPGGDFTLGRTTRKNIFMISTGTGLAPFVSMIRTLRGEGVQNSGSEFNIVVMHGVRRSEDLGYRNELEGWSREQSLSLVYIPTISQPGSDSGFHPDWSQSRVNDLLRHFLGEPPAGNVEPRAGVRVDAAMVIELLRGDQAFFLCGHFTMIAEVTDHLVRRGYSHVITEGW